MGNNENWEITSGTLHVIKTPWTITQVEILNQLQKYADHPYMCKCGKPFVACLSGWKCDFCQEFGNDWCFDVDLKPV